MKTLRISDDAHEKLTALLGELTAQTKIMQTYTDAIETLLKESIILPPELIAEVENFVKENKRLGYTTKEEFIRDAVRRRLDMLKGKFKTVEIPEEEYEELNTAIEEMNAPYLHAADFINNQIKVMLKEYAEFKKEKEERMRKEKGEF